MECSALVPLDTMITQNLRRPREFFLKFYQPSFDFLKYKKDETNSLFDEVEKRGAEILAKENALVYFDSVLQRLGIKPPQNKILMFIKLIFDLVGVTLNLYFPLRKTREIPDRRDNEIFNLSYYKGTALSFVNPIRT